MLGLWCGCEGRCYYWILWKWYILFRWNFYVNIDPKVIGGHIKIYRKYTWNFFEKPGNIMEISWNFVSPEMWEPWYNLLPDQSKRGIFVRVTVLHFSVCIVFWYSYLMVLFKHSWFYSYLMVLFKILVVLSAGWIRTVSYQTTWFN